MYRKFHSLPGGKNENLKGKMHVLMLAASIRSLDHFYASIALGADIMTVPMKILEQWIHEEQWIPDEHYRAPSKGLKSIVYKDLPFNPDFKSYDVSKEDGSLLDEGLKKFSADWQKLLQ